MSWRDLQTLAVAYSGLLGETAALTADRVDVERRRILIDRQVVEGRHGLTLAPPKSRTTMYPARTPEGAELGSLLALGLAELYPFARRRAGDASAPSPVPSGRRTAPRAPSE